MSTFETGSESLGQLFTAEGKESRASVMLVAFEGWNDGAQVASDVMRFLSGAWPVFPVGQVDPEEYYDFQSSRPRFVDDGRGHRRLSWPTTEVTKAVLGSCDVVMVHGDEPSYRWRAFCDEVLEHAVDHDVDYIIFLGALLADVPHSRAIPVSVSTDDPLIQERLGIRASTYRGPVGIVSVLADTAKAADLPAVSLWAAVPHYAAYSPSSKAVMALLDRLCRLLGISFDTSELATQARLWEGGVNELAQQDPQVREYVRQLEQDRDAQDLPEDSGDIIAEEFEKYLRQRGEQS